MTGYVLSPAAQADVESIWDYTVERWGERQAETYILAIRDACAALAEGRRRGRPIDAIRAGYLKLAVGAHFLFYRFDEAGRIDVVRILHQSMDVPAHLGDKNG